MQTAVDIALIAAASIALILLIIIPARRWDKQDSGSGAEHCCGNVDVDERSVMGQPGNGDFKEGEDAELLKAKERMDQEIRGII